MSQSFVDAVRSGAFAVTAECVPPCGAGVEGFKTCAATLGDLVDAISVLECEDGVRMSALAACGHLISAGAEPILHLLTRDMNRIALQAALLGAASMGVRSVLCTTGKHQVLTTSRSARGVFDVDPIQLLAIADGIRKRAELADGQSIDGPIDFVLGTDTNPFSDPVELQVMALQKAIAAGADFVITQTVSDMARFNLWMGLVRDKALHLSTCIIARVDSAETAKAVKGVEGIRGLSIAAGVDDDLAEIISGIARS